LNRKAAVLSSITSNNNKAQNKFLLNIPKIRKRNTLFYMNAAQIYNTPIKPRRFESILTNFNPCADLASSLCPSPNNQMQTANAPF
jgi:hypothetical protein